MKVLVIGSGPIVIGQAAEFDYAGTQACKALREEGHQVVLINSNPATIMTDPGVSDALYIEPLTREFCERVIERELPDALLPTLGGQTGLNLATQLDDSGVLDRYGVRVLGTPLAAIKMAEDRESFRALMREIREPVPESWIVESPKDLEELLPVAPFPCIVRPAYTLGGTGGGIAHNQDELREIGRRGLKLSMRGQIMVERSLLGWKEIEYEVMRDSKGNCITVCNMENFDPMGVHTGDSIVVAPSQTLSDIEYHMLRTASLKIIRALGIEGGCNVQLAVNPDSFDYYVIEVNPRVSRSSALASKATGYPIARVAAKIAVGRTLDEIANQVTKTTMACFEPALDYVVVKIPRWPFDKFPAGDRTLFTQMKATGEVMAIDRSFESALLKAVRGLEVKNKDLAGWGPMPQQGRRDLVPADDPVVPEREEEPPIPSRHVRDAGEGRPSNDELLKEAIKTPTDERLWAIAEGLRRGWSVEEVAKLCRVDKWFLTKIEGILAAADAPGHYRKRVFKMVDTCAGEFESKTPYYYSTEDLEDESADGAETALDTSRRAIVVLGSGPIRIGQGIEFDYSCVHCVWALQKMGYRAVIVNNNPETVSTDFDTGDALYFEPVTKDDVLRVIEHERAIGAVCQFGGQTAINLAQPLADAGVHVLGTAPEGIGKAEDRGLFDEVLAELGVRRPPGKAVTSLDAARAVAKQVGYPVLVRPSFVLGGRAMQIVYDETELEEFYEEAEKANPMQPVLVDAYILGDEAEVDVISDGVDTLVPGIMEHIERAGVHSGDSMAVYPPVNLSEDVQAQMIRAACRIARALEVKGLMNIQFVVRDETAYVLEVNPRASRTVPYLSKVTGVPMVELATRCMMGERLRDLGYESGLWCGSQGQDAPATIIPESAFADGAPALPEPHLYAVKAPVFSFQKLAKVEPSLGPEMKSTGEVLGIDSSFESALYKGLVGSGLTFRQGGLVLLTVRDQDKATAVRIGRDLAHSGFELAATAGTHAALKRAGVESRLVRRISAGVEESNPGPDILELVLSGEVGMMINTPSPDRVAEEEAALIRRACIETGVPCITSIDTAEALAGALEVFKEPSRAGCRRLEEYFSPAAVPVGSLSGA